MTEIILCLISRFLESAENRLTFGFWTDVPLLITYLTSLSRESVALGSALVTYPANHIWFARALASLDVTVFVDRASRVTVAGLKLQHASFQDF